MDYGRNIAEAAEILFHLRTDRHPIDALPRDLQPQTIDDAYVLQDCLNSKFVTAGLGPEVGYKIGCTTAVMQDYLGIDHPCAGTLLATTVQQESGTCRREDFVRPGVECEIAVDIAKDILSLSDTTPHGMAPYVGAARASIEIVDDRWTDFPKVSTPSLIADNFFNAGCVLGLPAEIDPKELDTVQGQMTINGTTVGRGAGADILGHPLNALAWLAEHQIRRGKPLRAGQTVTLGSMVQTVWIDAGDVIEVEVSDLGRCSLRFE